MSNVQLCNYISIWKGFVSGVELVGRHSLLTFFIHVYFAKAVLVSKYLMGESFPVPQIIMALNMCFTLLALQYIEARQRQNGFAKRCCLSHIYRLVS